MEDSTIIQLYWDRSEMAISATDSKYGPYLGVIARNILRDEQDAEECVNDTYLHTWNAIPPERPSAFRVWLGRITRNLSLDRWRMSRAQKRGGDETTLLLEELEACVPGNHNVEQSLADQEVAALISAFLRRQKPDSRRIFLRRYWYGDSVADIARILRISESKVKSSLFRSRNALRIYLEKEGISL